MSNVIELNRKGIDPEISEEEIVMDMVEHDYVVRMPPKRKYTIELEIKNIRRGEPVRKNEN